MDIKRMLMVWCKLFLIGSILIGFHGCTAKQPVAYQPMNNAVSKKDFPRRIAVLPFVNHTPVTGIETLFRANFYGHFSLLPYQDMELTRIDALLSADNKAGPEAFDPIALGKLLDCDALVVGSVGEYDKLFAWVYSHVHVKGSIEIWDTRSGEKIWTDQQECHIRDGGLPLDLLSLPLAGFRSGWNLRGSVKIRAVDQLSRRFVDRVPFPDYPDSSELAPASNAFQYVVQVGAYIEPAKADKAADLARQTGYTAFVMPKTDLQNATWHRVMMGPFETSGQALAAKDVLMPVMGPDIFIVRFPLDKDNV